MRTAVLLCVALLVGACGGGGGEGTSATSGASATATASAAPTVGGPGDWPTYHGDQARTGLAVGGPSSFTAIDVAWQSDALTGDVYGSPVVANGTVVVATERNVVYGFDVRTGAQRWRATLGTPVTSSTLPCGNIGPTSGITSTPVVDARASLAYVVAFETPYHHELYALDLSTGEVRFHRAVDAPGNDPKVHQQRSALTLANGRVYVAYGGLLGDCGAYRGTVVAVSASDPAGDLRFYRVPANREAGIWAPSGMAVDADGRIYAVTGNSDSSGQFDMNDAVLRLSPDLALESYWAPTEWLALSRSDTDIGSIGPTLVGGDRLIESGKNGVLYVLRASQLGGIGGQIASQRVCTSVFGGFAYANGVAYVPCSDGMAAVQIDPLRTLWRGPRGSIGPPILAGGAVWATDWNSGTLYALDPANGATRVQRSVGAMQHFTTPAAYGDLILVAAGGRLQALRMR